MRKYNPFHEMPNDFYIRLKEICSRYPELCKVILRHHLINSKTYLFWRDCVDENDYYHKILSVAIQKNNFTAFQELVDAGLNPLSDDSQFNESLIFTAAAFGHVEIVRYLLQHNASPNSSDITGASVLHRAVLSGSIETVKLLIDHGACLEDYDNVYEVTPLGLAVLNGKLEMVQFLMNLESYEDEDYLSLAAQSGSIPVFDYLYKRLGDTNDLSGIFEDAVSGGNLDMVRYILEFNEIPISEPHLTSVLETGNEHLFEFLLSPEFTRQLGQPVHWDPLFPGTVHAAIRGGNWRLLKRILEGGADPNQEMECTSAPVFSISSRSSTALIKTLLDSGADPNKRSQDGETPLAFAIKNHLFHLIRYLILKGAKP